MNVVLGMASATSVRCLTPKGMFHCGVPGAILENGCAVDVLGRLLNAVLCVRVGNDNFSKTKISGWKRLAHPRKSAQSIF